jgi:hypothetical protein
VVLSRTTTMANKRKYIHTHQSAADFQEVMMDRSRAAESSIKKLASKCLLMC